ncbi:MAG TPA: DotI/IcmL family type IV secretion protein [Bryobacteraceae bacterium]|jgi:hypothetical protein|nr:DotI/IcmL family type IV secretion protein [Bryobacteraceae bacterium]
MRFIALLSLLVFFAVHAIAAAADIATPKKIDAAALLAWASGTATSALSFDFEDYQRVFTNAKRNFTPEGWQSFEDSLKKSQLPDIVVKYQQTMYTEQNVTAPPKIESQGLSDGVYQWTVSVPVKRTIHAGNKTAIGQETVTMTLVEKKAIFLPTLLVVHWEEK